MKKLMVDGFAKVFSYVFTIDSLNSSNLIKAKIYTHLKKFSESAMQKSHFKLKKRNDLWGKLDTAF